MRVTKVSSDSHRYGKIMSPEFQGLIGRVYFEVQERKDFEKKSGDLLKKQIGATDILKYEMESMKVQNRKISNIIGQILPEGESWAVIDRRLLVKGSIKAEKIELTSEDSPAIQVVNRHLINNLNAEMVGGSTLERLQTDMDDKTNLLSTRISSERKEDREVSNVSYAPKSHVNEGGPGVHPYATGRVAGFMSPLDKFNHDNINDSMSRIELPGGMVVSQQPPKEPRVLGVWLDVSDLDLKGHVVPEKPEWGEV